MTVAGIDVGSRRDRTAMVAIDGRRVTKLAQLPVDLELSTQGQFLAPLAADLDLVAVDTTGLGLGLGEVLRGLGRDVLFVTFVAGEMVRRDGHRVQAGKLYLVQRLAVAIGKRSLDIPTTDLGRELVRQLGNMTARITARGGVKLEAPGVAADDLAMALALALLAQDIAGGNGNGRARVDDSGLGSGRLA